MKACVHVGVNTRKPFKLMQKYSTVGHKFTGGQPRMHNSTVTRRALHAYSHDYSLPKRHVWYTVFHNGLASDFTKTKPKWRWTRLHDHAFLKWWRATNWEVSWIVFVTYFSFCFGRSKLRRRTGNSKAVMLNELYSEHDHNIGRSIDITLDVRCAWYVQRKRITKQ